MLNDLLMLVATYLNLEDVSSYIDAVNTDEEVGDAPKDLTLLIRLANLTLKTITADYMPLYTEEQVYSDGDCQINYSGFSKTPIKIKSVSYLDGISATFRCFPSYVKVGYPNKKYLVKYAYAPEELTDLDDELEKPFGLSAQTIAFGICFEYYIANELYAEADMFEERFKQAILKDINSTRIKEVPKRGWV